jgi:hypothetical protein
MGANTQLNLICVLITGTTAASWQSSYVTDAFPLSVGNGGTGVTALPVTASASAFAAWDTNINMPANNFLSGFATTVSAAGTTILTVASAYNQEITGSTTQIIQMPVASTLVAGTSFKIINNSSASVTINSSGGNAILVMAANTTAFVTLVLNSGTTAASWNASYVFDNGAGVLSVTGTANQVIVSGSTGAVTFTLPQSIGTSSAVQFASVSFGGTALSVYQEGTWTPADGSGAGLSFTGVQGNYTRIGRMVTATCQITYPSTASGASAVISGLPFTVSSSGGSLGGLVVFTNASTLSRCITTAGGTGFSLFNSAGVAITNTAMTGSLNYFQLTYFV